MAGSRFSAMLFATHVADVATTGAVVATTGAVVATAAAVVVGALTVSDPHAANNVPVPRVARPATPPPITKNSLRLELATIIVPPI
jgi:hypothetical protein